MIFPENNLAIEERGCQYESSCKQNAFCEKGWCKFASWI